MATLVQDRFQSAIGDPVTSLGVSYLSTPTAGNMLVLVIGTSGATSARTGKVTSVSGGGVSSWTRHRRTTQTGTGEPTCDIWAGISDGSSSSITISTGNASSIVCNLSEWSSVPDPQVEDAEGGTTGSGSSYSASVTATATDLLIIAGACKRNGGFDSAPNSGGFSALDSGGTTGGAGTTHRAGLSVGYRTASSAGTFSTTWSDASSGNGWASSIVAFDVDLPAPPSVGSTQVVMVG